MPAIWSNALAGRGGTARSIARSGQSASKAAQNHCLNCSAPRGPGFTGEPGIAKSEGRPWAGQLQYGSLPDARAHSKSHADANSPPPDNAAFLSHIAVEELDAVRQRYHRKYFKTSAAAGIVDQSAGDRGRLRAHDDLGLARLRTRGPNSRKQSRRLFSWHGDPIVPHGGPGLHK
jgi:hypothetical protein